MNRNIGKQSLNALLAECLMSFKAVRLVRDLPLDVTAWRCLSTAASVVVGTVGNYFTFAIVVKCIN